LVYPISKVNTTKHNMTQPEPLEPLIQELQEQLTRLYGPWLGSKALWKVLGYASPAAYRQARIRGTLPVAEFDIEGWRGRFALT
jgi:hypothetical protein